MQVIRNYDGGMDMLTRPLSEPAASGASRVLQLVGRAEGVVFGAWRRLAAGEGGSPLLARDFARVFGEDAVELLAVFCTFLQALAYGARRRLALGIPGCAGLTLDERQLLALLAAAQAGDEARFEAHLSWLVGRERRQGAAIAARALATALALHELRLALPAPAEPHALIAAAGLTRSR
jgi:hypothetical protein